METTFMSRHILKLFACLGFSASVCSAQTLSAKWEDLTSADFVKAIQKADGVCLLPMGSIEKFGPSAPLGTNLYLGRIIPLEAVKQEYVLIFPEYFVAETSNTSTLPGTIHYSLSMQMQFLDETVHEMARNGCKKIILANGHSSNTGLINLFISNLTVTPHNYAVYYTYPSGFPVVGNGLSQLPPAAQPSKLGVDGHGGEERVAAMLAYYPALIHLERAHDEPTSIGHGLEGQPGQGGGNQVPAGAMTSLPTGYSGDAAGATAARGQALVNFAIDKLVKFIRAVKADNNTTKVEKEFYEHFEHPENLTPAK
jgi:creatinine amidohydrolase